MQQSMFSRMFTMFSIVRCDWERNLVERRMMKVQKLMIEKEKKWDWKGKKDSTKEKPEFPLNLNRRCGALLKINKKKLYI